MKHLNQKKPSAIQAEDIAAVAQRGVERALAARQQMMDLSAEQVEDVSGGILAITINRIPIINGGLFSPLLTNQLGNLTLPGANVKF